MALTPQTGLWVLCSTHRCPVCLNHSQLDDAQLQTSDDFLDDDVLAASADRTAQAELQHVGVVADSPLYQLIMMLRRALDGFIR